MTKESPSSLKYTRSCFCMGGRENRNGAMWLGSSMWSAQFWLLSWAEVSTPPALVGTREWSFNLDASNVISSCDLTVPGNDKSLDLLTKIGDRKWYVDLGENMVWVGSENHFRGWHQLFFTQPMRIGILDHRLSVPVFLRWLELPNRSVLRVVLALGMRQSKQARIFWL